MAKSLQHSIRGRVRNILILLSMLLFSNVLQAQQIAISYLDTPLKTVLQEIQKQSGYKFVYSPSLVDVEQHVSVEVQASSVAETMKRVLVGTRIEYRIVDKNIILSQKKAAAESKEAVFSGRVVDEHGNPVVGATLISVDADGKGAISCATNINGTFELSRVKPGTRFIISFIGKVSQDVTFDRTEPVTVILPTDTVDVDEVVVIGYGSKTRQNLTSSISSLSSKEIGKLAASSQTVDNMLGGAVKGVLSQQTSGEPGAITTLNIRGTTSPYPNMVSGAPNNVPLYVIDGIPFFVGSSAMNPLANLSASDIESVDILKDAAATAIYGSRGANGVVIVKTKDGRKGEDTSIEFGYSLSIANPVKSYKPLTTNQFKNLTDEIISSTVKYMNATMDSSPYSYGLNKFGNIEQNEQTQMFTYNGLREDVFGSKNIDWVKEIRNKNALTHQYNVGVRGGTEKTNYALSFNAINQDGLYINDYYQRYNTRISVDTQVAKPFSIGGAFVYSYGKRTSASLMDGVEDSMAPYAVRPDQPIYDELGNLNRIDMSSLYYGVESWGANPLAKRKAETTYSNNAINGMFYGDLTLCKGLKLYADFNMSMIDFKNSYYTPTVATDFTPAYRAELVAALDQGSSREIMTSANFRIDYEAVFKEKHRFDAMMGFSSDRNFYEDTNHSYEGFLPGDEMHDAGMARKILSYSTTKRRGGLNSIYARTSYGYDDRYLVEASLRADASSKFGPGNQWGIFPALSLGWRINSEKWLKESRSVDNLKLRASIGRTGSTNVADFSYNQYFIRASNTMYGNQMAVTINDLMPNKNIKWEMTTELNGGLDFGFFGNRLFGSVDLYYRKTDGALAPAPHSLESGLTVMYANLIDMSNKGFELEIGGDIIRGKTFTWNSVFNIARNISRVEKLNGANLNAALQDAITVGYPAGALKGYEVVKIFNNQEELDALNNIALEKSDGAYTYQESATGLGDYMIRDVNKDGRISSDDRTIIANPEPSCFGGWTNTFTWKGISLSCMFQYSIGGEAFYNSLSTDASGSIGNSVTRELYGNTWTPERTDAKYARLVFLGTNSYYNTAQVDRYVFDCSYLRMKYLTLSYDLPKTWMSKMHMSNTQIYFTVTNLFTVTDWPGIDPEQVNSSQLVGRAVNRDPYPLSRSFTFGVKLNF